MAEQVQSIIAIAGASASGKSLLAKNIVCEIAEEIGNDKIAVIKEDAYYRDQTHLSMEERFQTNYDHPDAFEHELLMQHLQMLRDGESIEVPTYCYTTHTRIEETTRVAPKRVVVIEGILLLSDPALRRQFDICVYVDTPLDICLLRRMQRDIRERGRSLESVIEQYQDTVRPMFFQYIKPSKHHADLVVPRGGKNRPAIELLKAKIKQLVGE